MNSQQTLTNSKCDIQTLVLNASLKFSDIQKIIRLRFDRMNSINTHLGRKILHNLERIIFL